ncbi:hypothetical protein BV898_19833 [Hypsibius exemplaris]|uniref:Uncharacterized protein n=1 Tax=Hypsibius exemplaris TaxID=2072580 RepID=A0A9X6RQ43_HYPEX|nr:hypothetical protein BV898_19833 [Hypsibius exemplaris]
MLINLNFRRRCIPDERWSNKANLFCPPADVCVVEVAVQSISNFTHSYLYMSIINANGEMKKPGFFLPAGIHRRIRTNCHRPDEESADIIPCGCLEI